MNNQYPKECPPKQGKSNNKIKTLRLNLNPFLTLLCGWRSLPDRGCVKTYVPF
jgi:hypothetical protein